MQPFPLTALRLPFTEQITPAARILTLMPSLQSISIIFRMPKHSDERRLVKLFKKPLAVQVIQHWLRQADQSCPLLQSLSIKVDIDGKSSYAYFVFDCVSRQQNQSKKWGVRIWRVYHDPDPAGPIEPQTLWIANMELAT